MIRKYMVNGQGVLAMQWTGDNINELKIMTGAFFKRIRGQDGCAELKASMHGTIESYAPIGSVILMPDPTDNSIAPGQPPFVIPPGIEWAVRLFTE